VGSGNFLLPSRDNLSVPSSGVKNPKEKLAFGFLTLQMGPIGCPATSVGNYHNSLSNNPEQRGSHLLRGGIIAVFSEIHTKHINTLCGQNVEYLNVKVRGTYSNHWALEG
jgi:hypothetical protein